MNSNLIAIAQDKLFARGRAKAKASTYEVILLLLTGAAIYGPGSTRYQGPGGAVEYLYFKVRRLFTQKQRPFSSKQTIDFALAICATESTESKAVRQN